MREGAEVRKLVRPLLLWSSGTAIALSLLFVSIYQSAAEAQWENVRAYFQELDRPDAEICGFLREQPGPECESAKNEERGFARAFRGETIAKFRLAAMLQHPLAAGGAAAGLVVTAAGAFVLAGVAGGHVGGEWSGRTIANILTRDPRRSRFVLGKFLSVWIAGIWLLATVWAIFAALGPLFRTLYDVPPSPPGFDAAGFALPRLARAIVAIGAVAALGTAAGAVTRHQLGGFALASAFIVTTIGTSVWEPTRDISLAYWIAAWMGFDRIDMLGDHVWVDQFPGAQPSGSAALIGLAGFSALALLVAFLRMRVGDSVR